MDSDMKTLGYGDPEEIYSDFKRKLVTMVISEVGKVETACVELKRDSHVQEAQVPIQMYVKKSVETDGHSTMTSEMMETSLLVMAEMNSAIWKLALSVLKAVQSL